METATPDQPPALKKAKKNSAVVGDIVEIRFHDHAEDSPDGAMEFVVYGKVAKVTRTSIIVHSWAFANDQDEAENGCPDNVKSFTIVRKAILQVRQLVPVTA